MNNKIIMVNTADKLSQLPKYWMLK